MSEVKRQSPRVLLGKGLALRKMPASWLYGGFGVFALLLSALGLALHEQSRQAAEETARQSLASTARLSVHALELWANERIADADTIASNPLVTDAMERWLSSADGADLSRIQVHLDAVRQRYGYKSIAIIDTSSPAVVVSSGAALSNDDLSRIVLAKAGPQARWVRLPSHQDGLLRAGAARRLAGSVSAAGLALFLELDPSQLVSILKEAQPQNWTGETLLVNRREGSVSYLAPSGPPVMHPLPRPEGGTAPSIEHPSVSADQVMTRGNNRLGTAVFALRMTSVVAGWQVVSMIDAASVYASLRRVTLVAVPVSLVMLMLMFSALVMWRRQERFRQALREGETRRYYEDILLGSADSFVLNDVEGNILQVSDSALRLFGYTREQMLLLKVPDLMTTEQLHKALLHAKGMVHGEHRAFQLERVRADGSVFLQEGHVGLTIIDGKRYYHTTGRDVTQQHAIDTKLRVAASFFERSVAAVVISDARRRIIMVNPSFYTMTGYELEEVVGMEAALLSGSQDADLTQRMLQDVDREGYWDGEMAGRRKNGEIYPRHLRVTAFRDANGKIDQYVSIFSDLSQLRTAQNQAEYFAHHDSLTGLPNRAELDRLLPALLERAQQRGDSVTVAMVNVDRFKGINETLGHAQGDVLLVTLARRLRIVFPDSHQLFRYGGDEFMVVLQGEPVSHAMLLGKVRPAIAPSVALAGHSVSPSASFGVAIFPEHADTAGTLLRNVGAALGMAKAQGRNTWRMYEAEMNASVYDDMLMAVDLREAMAKKELELYLQPQFRIIDGAMVGMEALLRWKHPTRGMVSPAKFIPIAESSGLIVDISAWVLREACRLWAGWRDARLDPPPVAVNLSALQFQHPDFLQEVAQTLAAFGLPPHALEMELTEGLIMGDTEAAIATMHQLVDMGIQLAIDDFGTGYSSLSYLQRFPVKKLKIDRSFVLGLGRSQDLQGAVIASAIIGMAKNLDLKVIAEGVETAEQRDFLREQGCEEVQGYLYAKPMPEADVARMLNERAERSLPKLPPSGVVRPT